MIENRIGLERFQDAIGGLARHEVYSRTLKHPQPSVKNPSELLLDHEFCRLSKALEGMITKSVLDASSLHNENQTTTPTPPDSVLVAQYKEVIREQDIQIQKLNQVTESLAREKHELELQAHDLRSTISHLKDQNLVLRAARTNMLSEEIELYGTVNNGDSAKELEKCRNVVVDLENRLAEYTWTINEYKRKFEERDEADFECKLKDKSEELEKLKKDQEDLLELLTDQDSKIIQYKERLIALGEKVFIYFSRRVLITERYLPLG